MWHVVVVVFVVAAVMQGGASNSAFVQVVYDDALDLRIGDAASWYWVDAYFICQLLSSCCLTCMACIAVLL